MIPLLLLLMPTTTGLISLTMSSPVAEVALLSEVVEAVVEAVAVDFQAAVAC
jgi:hypothetical protein